MVIWKEKKASAPPCSSSSSFTSLKHLILIYFHFQRLKKSVRGNIVLFLYFKKMFIIDTFNFKLNWNLQRVLYLSDLIFNLSCIFPFIFNGVIYFHWNFIGNVFYLKINIRRAWILKYFFYILWYKLSFWSHFPFFKLLHKCRLYYSIFIFVIIFNAIQKYFLILLSNTS